MFGHSFRVHLTLCSTQARKENVMSSRRLFPLVSTLIIIAAMSMLTVGSVAAQETGMSVTVQLQEYDNSGISGTATLTETTTGGTHVSMILTGAELDGNHPTHIHTGTCDNFDPNPLYPLETVNLSPINKDGISETSVNDVSLEELYDGDYVILVHQSPEQLTKYLVCGEISSGEVGTAPLVTPGNPPASHHVPATGSGSGLGVGSSGSGLFLLFGALAFISAMTASVIRRNRNWE
jgi:hypothetical protein